MDEMSIVPHIDQNNYATLKAQEIVSGGMLPKIDNAFKAIQNGVSQVWIKHAKNLNNASGTLIKI
jgi:acetylglutamate kinase